MTDFKEIINRLKGLENKCLVTKYENGTMVLGDISKQLYYIAHIEEHKYNYERPHPSLDYDTPLERYAILTKNLAM